MADDALVELAAELGQALKARGWMLVLAESCTGGGVAEAITSVPGSSAWFERGFVTYGNVAKIEMLDVRAETLQEFGAVSEQTVREMVQGALAHSHAQLGIAISGIAGPDGGTPGKPVGTICFAWANTTGELLSATCHFSGDRAAVRQQAVEHAIRGALQLT
ncbi:MAG: nicotinamide-nucleotide amidohydrolase family protein [Nitrosomonadales bacterium]|nr:MAG: nicotinamide-nucleotide amidohydrolase family protein [Nitrosomonadales bacterium]